MSEIETQIEVSNLKTKLRIFEAFAGIGAQSMALKRLGADYEVVGISERMVDAIICYDAIHHAGYPPIEVPSYEEQIEYLTQFEFSRDSVRKTNLKQIESRHVSQFANSQNKVTAADLNSNHPFYQRIEDFSRKIYAPAANGSPLQTIWFFERSRGQYEQPKMKMSKGERGTYERINPPSQRFDKTDLAKFINSADIKPYDVAWGREVNAVRFQVEMEKQWKADPSVFNESYYRDLIAKAIIFITTRKTILSLDWYKENKGYLVQLVTYTFAKLSYEVQRLGKVMNYRYIWDKQGLPDFLIDEISDIAYQAREVFFSPDRTNGNIETFCKQKECWVRLQATHYELSEKTKAFLIDHEDVHDEKIAAKKDQRFSDSIDNEIEIFEKGDEYWERLKITGLEQGVINGGDAQNLDLAIAYCQGTRSLPPMIFKKIIAVREKLREAQIQV